MIKTIPEIRYVVCDCCGLEIYEENKSDRTKSAVMKIIWTEPAPKLAKETLDHWCDSCHKIVIDMYKELVKNRKADRLAKLAEPPATTPITLEAVPAKPAEKTGIPNPFD